MASGTTAEGIKTIETMLGEKTVVWITGAPGARWALVPWEGGGYALHGENTPSMDNDADGILQWYFILFFGGGEADAIRAAKKFVSNQSFAETGVVDEILAAEGARLTAFEEVAEVFQAEAGKAEESRK